jgi:hypothetical protein
MRSKFETTARASRQHVIAKRRSLGFLSAIILSCLVSCRSSEVGQAIDEGLDGSTIDAISECCGEASDIAAGSIADVSLDVSAGNDEGIGDLIASTDIEAPCYDIDYIGSGTEDAETNTLDSGDDSCEVIICPVDGGGRLALCTSDKSLIFMSGTTVTYEVKCGPISVVGMKWAGDKGFASYFSLSEARSGGYEGYFGSLPLVTVGKGGVLDVPIDVLSCAPSLKAWFAMGYSPFPASPQDVNPDVILDTTKLVVYGNY